MQDFFGWVEIPQENISAHYLTNFDEKLHEI